VAEHYKSIIFGDGEEVYVETDCGKYTPSQIREKVAAFAGEKTVWVCPAGREDTMARHGARGEFYTYSIS